MAYAKPRITSRFKSSAMNAAGNGAGKAEAVTLVVITGHSGAGKSEAIADLLPEGPVLFVTDAQLVELSLVDSCFQALEASGRPVTIFDQVEADPSRRTLEAAVEAGRSAGARSVVGFGGGSPMDVAKLAAYLLGSGEPLASGRGEKLPPDEPPTLELRPTLARGGKSLTG